MKTLLTSIFVVALAVFVASPVSATVILADNFDADTDGALTGQLAQTGQTWTVVNPLWTWVGGTMSVADQANMGKGAGNAAAGAPGLGNEIALGAQYTTGLIQVDLDTVNPAATSIDLQWSLRDMSGGSYGIGISPHVNGDMSSPWANQKINFEGEGAGETGAMLGWIPGALHQTLLVDLDNNTATLSWYDKADPTNVARQGTLGAIALDTASFGPDTMQFYAYKYGGGGILASYDNLYVQWGATIDDIGPIPYVPIPEPSTLVLLTAGLLCYAWRKRK